MRHFAAAKLKLHSHLVPFVEKLFPVAYFCQVIVVVDVNAKLDFLEFGAGGPLVLVVLGNVVTEFPERDDFANRGIGRGRDLDNIKSEALRFAQGIGKLHDAQLFAGGSQNDPDLAGANPTVYTKLWLQIKSSSWPVKRECTAPPLFPSSHFPDTLM
jgi:hypothetical protein